MPNRLRAAARRALGIEDRLAGNEITIRRLDAEQARLHGQFERAHAEAELVQRRLEREVERLRERAEVAAAELQAAIGHHATAISELQTDARDRLRRWATIGIESTWTATQRLHSPSVVSIVLATHNRRNLVERAIESVLAQTRTEWELIVVDDGSSDDTADYLDVLQDPRIVRRRTEGLGAAGARNVGLDSATGQYVAFLDDDNLMAPGWVHAIVARFESDRLRNDVDAIYGAQVRPFEPGLGDSVHLLFEEPFDLDRLLTGNYIDLGAFAARRDIAELRFDEDPDIASFEDWEMIARVAMAHRVEAVHAVASVYNVDAPGRLSFRPEHADIERALVERFATTRAAPPGVRGDGGAASTEQVEGAARSGARRPPPRLAPTRTGEAVAAVAGLCQRVGPEAGPDLVADDVVDGRRVGPLVEVVDELRALVPEEAAVLEPDRALHGPRP